MRLQSGRGGMCLPARRGSLANGALFLLYRKIRLPDCRADNDQIML